MGIFKMRLYNRLRYIFYRVNCLENRLAELENFVGDSISAPSCADKVSVGETKAIEGNWERLDTFSCYKRSRGILSAGDLFVGFDGFPGSLKRYDGEWHNVFDQSNLSEIPTIIKHGDEIWFGCSSRESGASIWRGDGKRFEQVGSWPEYFGALSLYSFNGLVYCALCPFDKNVSGAPVLAYDGKWNDIYVDHPYWCVYDMHEHNNKLFGSTMAAKSFGGHVVELSPDGCKVVGGEGQNGSWNQLSAVLRLFSHGNTLFAIANRTPPISNGVPNLWALENGSWKPLPSLPLQHSKLYSFNALTVFQNKLIIGCGGRPSGLAAVLSLDGDNWSQIGGNGISGSWSPCIFRRMNKPLFPSSTTEYIYQFCHHDGNLIAGFGASKGCGQVWQFTPS